MLGDDDDLFLSFFNKLVPNMMMIDFGWVFLILSTNTYTFHTYSLSLSFLHFLHFLGEMAFIFSSLQEKAIFFFLFLQCIYVITSTDPRYIHTYEALSLFFKPLLKWLLHMT